MIQRSLLAIALAGVSLAAPAGAQDLKEAREACTPDYKKYCAGVMPGGGRVKKCLTDNLDKLAPHARRLSSPMRAQHRSRSSGCRCGILPGGGTGGIRRARGCPR